jgi:hypothetical protein
MVITFNQCWPLPTNKNKKDVKYTKVHAMVFSLLYFYLVLSIIALQNTLFSLYMTIWFPYVKELWHETKPNVMRLYQLDQFGMYV